MTAPTRASRPCGRYQHIILWRNVYVDSSCHYHGEVSYRDARTGKVKLREYCWELVDPLGVQMPKYIEDECERLWLALLKSGEARFYEYDRDGNRRYTDLRYYDPADVARIVEALEERQNGR